MLQIQQLLCLFDGSLQFAEKYDTFTHKIVWSLFHISFCLSFIELDSLVGKEAEVIDNKHFNPGDRDLVWGGLPEQDEWWGDLMTAVFIVFFPLVFLNLLV